MFPEDVGSRGKSGTHRVAECPSILPHTIFFGSFSGIKRRVLLVDGTWSDAFEGAEKKQNLLLPLDLVVTQRLFGFEIFFFWCPKFLYEYKHQRVKNLSQF